MDRLQNTDRVQLEGTVPQYDFVEKDRIVGPEFLGPCFEESDGDHQELLSDRDYSVQHLRPGEVMRRLKLFRCIGMPHAGIHNDEDEVTVDSDVGVQGDAVGASSSQSV